MTAKVLNAALIAFVLSLGWSVAWSGQAPKPPYPANATFTTLALFPLQVEGLTGDGTYLYGAARQTNSALACPVYRVALNATPPASFDIVGNIPAGVGATCNPAGVAFNDGWLYVAESGTAAASTSKSTVYRLMPNAATPPLASAYATNVPGANGIAFKKGHLWISDGTTNQGRVWKVGPGGGDCTYGAETNCEEVFRIQPMRNSTALGGNLSLDGIGRQARDFLPGTLANNLGGQDLVANGLAFNAEGNLLVADTARGALWLVKFNKDGTLKSQKGCDSTFHSNTLCLDNLFRADPRLEGVDGIALDNSGNIWASVNERNAIVFSVFYGTSNSVEVFRNPVNASGLRNSADASVGNNHILEFPTSPFLSGAKFCTSSADGDRRDNSPASAGEIAPNGPMRGKISCIDQELGSAGLPLPR